MTIGFARDIKPYFTACYRAHMIDATGLDLWSESKVKDKFQSIVDIVEAKEMPPDASQGRACPEGGWDELTRTQFLNDFRAWKDGGFQP
jgi:hypothetical protein